MGPGTPNPAKWNDLLCPIKGREVHRKSSKSYETEKLYHIKEQKVGT